MSISLRKLTAVVTAAAIASSASIATAMPLGGLALKNATSADIEQVRWGGRGLGWGLGAGLLGGAIIGGLAAPRYYYGPGPYYYGPGPYYAPAPVYTEPGPAYADPDSDPVAYCSARFRSYDPRSGTYLGYDGLRHPCP